MALRIPSSLRTLTGALLLAGSLGAQADSILQVVQETIKTNPEVQAKWHQLQAAGHERSVTLARLLPTIDVVLGIGSAQRNSPLYAPPGTRNYDFVSNRLTLRQNFYDGFATLNDAQRLADAAMVRYYELLDLSERNGLEAAKAYIDTWRYQQLVAYAEDNLELHHALYEQIKKRTQAGVGRKADLESAGGRLALAESNLLTETSNLHDVSARFQRVVGRLPVFPLDPPRFAADTQMPAERSLAVNRSYESSPAIKAAMFNVLSARGQVRVQQSAMSPRLDGFFEKTDSQNMDGYTGRTDQITAGLTATYNVFNGNRDLAQIRKAGAEADSAVGLGERVCRDVRQSSAIALSDYQRLQRQLALLDQHQLSTDKAREAFRRQFDIGQRTLLDVLDTENEYYTARRNYLNGEMDLLLAQARYLAFAGELLGFLKLTPLADKAPFGPGEIPPGTINGCPPEALPLVKKNSYVVLVASPDGTTGKVVMQGSKGEQVLNTAKFGVPLDGSEAPRPVSEEKLQRDFGEAMSARPILPERFILYFDLGGTRLTRESQAEMQKVLASIRARPLPEVTIIGHADALGSASFNRKLSEKRARSLADQIRAQKLKVHSLSTEARGKEEPALPTADNTSEVRNRRVEIAIR